MSSTLSASGQTGCISHRLHPTSMPHPTPHAPQPPARIRPDGAAAREGEPRDGAQGAHQRREAAAPRPHAAGRRAGGRRRARQLQRLRRQRRGGGGGGWAGWRARVGRGQAQRGGQQCGGDQGGAPAHQPVPAAAHRLPADVLLDAQRHPAAAAAGAVGAQRAEAGAARPGGLPAGPRAVQPLLGAVHLPRQHKCVPACVRGVACTPSAPSFKGIDDAAALTPHPSPPTPRTQTCPRSSPTR
jgi:hypothetical protein